MLNTCRSKHLVKVDVRHSAAYRMVDVVSPLFILYCEHHLSVILNVVLAVLLPVRPRHSVAFELGPGYG